MTKNAKILIVDDDVDCVDSTRTILESKPYEVIVAYEGEEGLKKAKEENPDLILLDVIMPVKDGFTVAEQLKKDSRLSKIPLIMLTGFSSRRQESSIPVSRGTAHRACRCCKHQASDKEAHLLSIHHCLLLL